MKKLLSIIVGVIVFYFTFQLNSCKDDNINTPEEQGITISGTIDLPNDITQMSDLSVEFNQKVYTPDAEGKFNLECENDSPGMLIVHENNNPILLGIIPNPEKNSVCDLNIHSTALSLVFLNPFICTSDPKNAAEVVKRLETYQELYQLENIIAEKFQTSSNTITTSDNQVENAIRNIVIKYINSISIDTSNSAGSLKKTMEDVVTISPVNIVSGHQIKHLETNKFSVSNWHGRWAKCFTPNDTMYLEPNNDFISTAPWAPSENQFTLDIVPNEESKKIVIYGLGLNNEENETWDKLTDFEKEQVEFTGRMTVLIEFLPHILSLCTNFPFTFGGNKKEATEFVGNIFRWQIQYAKNFEKAKLLLSDGKYWDYYWTLLKEYISLLATDDNFRDFFLKAAKISITKATFEQLAKIILLPANVIYISDDLTGIAKTVIGLSESKYKITFEIYSEEFKFGNVNGNVYDKESGTAIQGAIVQLTGDENNPLNPSHTYTTDAYGGFWFENIQEGEISLTASEENYGSKTVTAQVAEGETSEVTIILSKEKGTVQGKVVNEVFIKNGVTPTNFNKDCHLDVQEIGRNNYSSSFWIWASKKGEFELELTPGTYELKVWHEDYNEEKDTITISGDEINHIPDIILKPNCSSSGTVKFDMNFDNNYEYQYDFEADIIGGTYLYESADCENNADRTGIGIFGMNDNETYQLIIDTFQVKNSDAYPIGDIWHCGCPGMNGKSTAMLITNRFQCTHPDYDYQQDMIFGFTHESEDIPCNCGITNPGYLYITKFSTKLGDAIEGDFLVDLPGWKGCHCGCCDKDGNYEVDCAKVQIDIKFKIIVGSLYEDSIPTKIMSKILN